MSSGEDYGGFGSDDDGYGFSDEDGGSDVDVENQYYSSKGLLEGGDNKAALEGFRAVRIIPPPPRARPRPRPSAPPCPPPPACPALLWRATSPSPPGRRVRVSRGGEGGSPRRC